MYFQEQVINVDPFSASSLHKIITFNLMFTVILMVATMSSLGHYKSKKNNFAKAFWVGLLNQYVLIPCFAFVFTHVFATNAQESFVIYLLIAFPSNRFVLLLPWLAGGCALIPAAIGVVAVLATFCYSPFIFTFLMQQNPVTIEMMHGFTYSEFISLVFNNRVEFLLMIIPGVFFGIYFSRNFADLYDVIYKKVFVIAIAFMWVFIIITVMQSQELFLSHWDMFSWRVLLFNFGCLLGAVYSVRYFKLPAFTGRAVVFSVAQNFLAPCFILVYAWYPHFAQAKWLFFVQLGIYHYCLLFLALFYRVKDYPCKNKNCDGLLGKY